MLLEIDVFSARLPDVPRLFYAVDTVGCGKITTSATGLDESLARARLRCAQELRERVEVQGWLGAQENAAGSVQGTACAHNPNEALKRASLEAIERLAAEYWWMGGRPANALTSNEEAIVESCIARWCRKTPRETRILGLPLVMGIRVIAAVSNLNGRGDICIGVAARTTGARAVRAAIREMFQMEFGLEVIRYRMRNGIAPSAREEIALDRARSLMWQDFTGVLATVGLATDDGLATWGSGGSTAKDILALLSAQDFNVSHSIRACNDGVCVAFVTIANPKHLTPVVKPGVWTQWPLYL